MNEPIQVGPNSEIAKNLPLMIRVTRTTQHLQALRTRLTISERNMLRVAVPLTLLTMAYTHLFMASEPILYQSLISASPAIIGLAASTGIELTKLWVKNKMKFLKAQQGILMNKLGDDLHLEMGDEYDVLLNE